MFRYTVIAQFEQADIADEWVAWLRGGHCRAVIEGGALSGEVVRLDPESDLRYEVRYDFPDRETFTAYQTHHAPGLIAEGLERFPTTRGIIYARSTGSVCHKEN